MRRRSASRQMVARAARSLAEGADVIDLGCLPGMPFPHLEEAVEALNGEGFKVSVDSGDARGAAARRQGRRRLPCSA